MAAAVGSDGTALCAFRLPCRRRRPHRALHGRPEEFTLHLRIPGWSQNTVLSVNGASCGTVTAGSYHPLRRCWQNGDVIALTLDMTPHFWPHPQQDRFSVYRGPLLLARRLQTENDGAAFAPSAFQSASVVDGNALVTLQAAAADGTPVLFTDYYSAGKDGGRFVTWHTAAGELPSPAEPIWFSR